MQASVALHATDALRCNRPSGDDKAARERLLKEHDVRMSVLEARKHVDKGRCRNLGRAIVASSVCHLVPASGSPPSAPDDGFGRLPGLGMKLRLDAFSFLVPLPLPWCSAGSPGRVSDLDYECIVLSRTRAFAGAGKADEALQRKLEERRLKKRQRLQERHAMQVPPPPAAGETDPHACAS